MLCRRNTKSKTSQERFCARVGINEKDKAVAENWQRQEKISTVFAETDKIALENKLQNNVSVITTDSDKFALENKVQKISTDNCGSPITMIKKRLIFRRNTKSKTSRDRFYACVGVN